MSCADPLTCPNGNCIGCKNGVPWCTDPRCSPYCANCGMVDNVETLGNITVTIILLCLVAILFVVWFVYGPSLIHRVDTV